MLPPEKTSTMPGRATHKDRLPQTTHAGSSANANPDIFTVSSITRGAQSMLLNFTYDVH